MRGDPDRSRLVARGLAEVEQERRHGAKSQLALTFAEWGSVGLALPCPLLAVIKAQTLREKIVNLE